MIKIIRLTNRECLDEVIAIHQEVFPSSIKFNKNDLIWVAIDLQKNNKIVAYATARVLAKQRSLKIALCGVTDKYKGQGLQVRLIKARVAYAKKENLGSVITNTVANPTSENNLIKCKFKLYRPIKFWAGSGSNYWYRNL